ncbi:histidinol-phosphate transaminase [Bacillus sp. B-jedd]|uniref:histidinol-phosphate transaminase n=1 Tax=Bacillus sp. B-jedd TaxID=1476857 RepID=UPI001E313942|nr:histidinol-phosphate transaminase [Bacillus sp. B-jedd]
MANINARDELGSVIPYPLGPPPEEIQKEQGFTRIIRMGDNENPYGSSPKAREAAEKALESCSFYPDGTYSHLFSELGRYHGLPEDNFIVGNGSDEIIRLLTRAYIGKGDEAVMADCTFPRYKTNVLIEGGQPVEVPLLHGVHDLKGMLGKISTKTKMVFVCNPNNPTGTIVKKDYLREFCEQVPEHVMIVLDEAYFEYVEQGAMTDAKVVLGQYKNAVILRTFSKIHGLAGLRIGYGMMAPEIVGELKKVRDVFNVNRIGAAAAAASLTDKSFLEMSAARNRIERDFVSRNLSKMGYIVLPSEANFVFVKINEPARQAEAALARKGIFVKGISAPGFPNALRVALGTREENERFLEAIREFTVEGVI